jgi:hypothetical protein
VPEAGVGTMDKEEVIADFVWRTLGCGSYEDFY